MCIESKYLVNRFLTVFKYVNPEDIEFYFKNFYTFYTYAEKDTKIEHTCWFEEDIKPDINYIKSTIIGISLKHDNLICYVQFSNLRSLRFNYAWSKIGTFAMPLNNLLNDSFDQFAKSIYNQILIYVNNGKDIYAGSSSNLLFGKNTAYQILIETELTA